MEKEKYVPTRCWCWSPIKGAKLSALKNSKTIPEIEEYIKEHNAVVYYRQRFYESVYDVPFVQEYSIMHTFCFETGSIPVVPTIDIVPKGSYIKKSFNGTSGSWIFPEGTV